MKPWGFYGRTAELSELGRIFGRGRWFFARVTGRRRIGKTSLVQRALAESGHRRILYVQIPDSGPAGVLSSMRDAMDVFEVPSSVGRPDSLLELAKTIETLAKAGYVVALDEFQYFSRKHLSEFTSHLQASVDRLSAVADSVPGGLIVLGSLHAELAALLEDREAPLYNRTTDQLELQHLDTHAILEILQTHADISPQRILFLWNLFEGVPKFYRDAFEQGVIHSDRAALLQRMFFESSSPLRAEADNWFLSELRGRYDVVLKFVARSPGCTNGAIESHVREVSPGTAEQVGGYLKILIDRYRMIERRLPVMAPRNARRGRYYLRDNFLRCWLAALQNQVAAAAFRPLEQLVDNADQRLADAEGPGLERLVAQLYEERSRAGVGDFSLTRRIDGYWDRGDTEIDLVALHEESRIIRFGSCKRNHAKLLSDIPNLKRHAKRFLDAHPKLGDWQAQYVAIAPEIPRELVGSIQEAGVIPQDLRLLTA
jgi:AAA+ ATPase superfamily predicted ATPase